MGWASANEIFDATARELLASDISEVDLTRVLAVLIRELQQRGWDTEGESLGDFQDNEAVVEAFRRQGVIITCGNEDPEDEGDTCERERLPRGHQDGMHEDWKHRKWPVKRT